MAGQIKNSRRFSRRSTASRVTDDSHPSHSLVSLFAPVILAALSRSSMPLHRTHTATSQIASVPLFAVVWSFVQPYPVLARKVASGAGDAFEAALSTSSLLLLDWSPSILFSFSSRLVSLNHRLSIPEPGVNPNPGLRWERRAKRLRANPAPLRSPLHAEHEEQEEKASQIGS